MALIKKRRARNRSTDGRFQNVHKPVVSSEISRRARWVEIHALKLKRLPLSFAVIAEQLTQAGRGMKVSMIEPFLPADASYSITQRGVYEAYQRAQREELSPQAEEMRKDSLAYYDDLLFNLRSPIAAGDQQAIRTAILALEKRANLAGVFYVMRTEQITGGWGSGTRSGTNQPLLAIIVR